MKGTTNAIKTNAIEKIKVTLKTNQTDHSDLINTKFTLTYGAYSKEYIWEGVTITIDIPANIIYTITFSDIDQYATPSSLTYNAILGNSRTIEAIYRTELLTINVQSNNGELDNYQINIYKQEPIGTYTRLEYIESTGTQYIDTGFKPNQNTRIETKIVCPVNGTNNWVFGARKSTTANKFCFVANANGYYQSQFGSENYNLSTSYNRTGAFIIDKNKTKVIFDGSEIKTHTSSTFTAPVNLVLFGSNTNGTIAYGSIKMYYCKIYDNETLIRDYIPALRSDGVAGFYDVVNNTFTASSGSNNFIAGNVVIATQTSTTGTYKIPYGVKYKVQANDVDGYITPTSITRTASVSSYSVTQLYEVVPVKDLSKFDIYGNPIAQSTANCYVVSKADTYKIPLVFGNALKNGATNSAAYTKNSGSYSHDFVDYNGTIVTSPYIETVSGTATNAQLSIADTDGIFTDISIVDGSPCRYLQFKVNSIPATGANGVLSIKDSSGVIMWSWHIWVWADSLATIEITNSTSVKYKILPVNLASKWDSSSKTTIKNWYYQFGRPNPMLCPSSYNSTSNHASFGVLSYAAASIASNIQTGIKNPATFYKYSSSYNYNWFQTNSGKTYNLWDAACASTGNSDNNVVKTIYDPCPIGFKMPNGNSFTGFSVINNANGIVKFTRYSGDSTGVGFSMSGCRSYSGGSLNLVGSSGYVWLSSAGSQRNAYGLYFDSSNVNPQNNFTRAYGFSVRPVQDEDLELSTHKLTINVSGDIPASYNIKVYQLMSDNTLGEVLATQSTVTGVYELTWGISYRIVASNSDGYVTPASQDYIADVENRTVTIDYMKRPGTLTPTNGIYIQDIEGYFHTADEWDNTYTPNGIAVITENHSFVMALTDVSVGHRYMWGGYGTRISGMSNMTSTSSAQIDFNGAYYTNKIIDSLSGTNDGYVDGAPAAEACRAFIFPNGATGYLGSGGEWYQALINKAAIDYALTKCGGLTLYNSSNWYYWTSLQYSAERSWYASWLYTALGNRDRNVEYVVRAFCAI